MAQKLAGLNTHGLCDWLTKKGITDFVSHIQAWNYDGQQLVALSEEQIVGLEICEASRKKLLKVIYPNSTAMSNGSGLLSRFRKKGSASQSADAGADNEQDFYDDGETWDDDEFEDEFDSNYDPMQDAAPAAHPSLPPADQGRAAAYPGSPSIGSSGQSSRTGSVTASSSSRAKFASRSSYDQTTTNPIPRCGSAVLTRHPKSTPGVGGASELLQQEYYNPNMDRRSAEYLLQQAQVDGSFVVRTSSKVSGEFSLSLLFQGHIRHLRIRRRIDGMFALGEQKPGEKYFVSVVEMVSYHKCEPINLQSGGYTILTYGYR